MTIRTVGVRHNQTNCYIVYDEENEEAMVIDPGGDPETIVAELLALGRKAKYIINTHGHLDHIAGNRELKEATGAALLIHAADARALGSPEVNLSSLFPHPVTSPPADQLLSDGDQLEVGGRVWKVIHTPGHTPGSICLLSGFDLFTGDTLFAGSVGRTDLPGGDTDLLLRTLRRGFLPLSDHITIYPGHGPVSSIAAEKKHNPFLIKVR
ncbi:MAG: MBL fold metallo-hydrolase [Bacillota bacterium]